MTNRNRIKNFGYVSRMDNLQAAVLNFRLKNLKSIIKKRRKNAEIYFKNLNKKYVFIPPETKKEFNTYHTFVVQVSKRDKLKRHLEDNRIFTGIHYPYPLHHQKNILEIIIAHLHVEHTHRTAREKILIFRYPYLSLTFEHFRSLNLIDFKAHFLLI